MKKENKIVERLPGDHYINLGREYAALGRKKEAERFIKSGEQINQIWLEIVKARDFSPRLESHRK